MESFKPIQHKIYLIRHGDVNLSPDICYGQLDCDVTGSFENDLTKLTEFIRNKCLLQNSLIISSPLKRCLNLAEGVSKCLQNKVAVKVSEHLQEISFGNWEGLTWDEIGHVNLQQWNNNLLDFCFVNGESTRSFNQRVVDTWLELNNQLSEFTQPKTIFIICHAGVIRSILSHFLHIPLQHALTLKIDKMSVSELKIVPSQYSLSRCVGVNHVL